MKEIYIAITYLVDSNDGEMEILEDKEELDAFIEKIKTEKGVCYERVGYVDTYSYFDKRSRKFDDSEYAYRYITKIYKKELYKYQKVEPLAPFEIEF